MKNKALKRQMQIRYCRELYLGFDKGSLYHFSYAYKRFAIEIVRSFVWALKSISVRKNITSQIGIFSTLNQYKALTKAKEANVFDGNILPINELSGKYCFFRLIIWILKSITYPFVFIFAKQKHCLYMTLGSGMMQWYTSFLATKLSNSSVQKLIVSNDHAGDVFILTILMRTIPNVTVAYVQHGAVKPEFPTNYFDEVYVYNKFYANVYKTLCQKELVKIAIEPELSAHIDNTALPNIDCLVCLSHQFPAIDLVKSLKLLQTLNVATIAIRFHPSDRLSTVKYRFLKYFYKNLTCSSPNISYQKDFDRSSFVLCASSSLILDAFNDGYQEKLIWVKPFGLTWDYYQLESKLKVVNQISDFSKFVGEDAL